RRAWHRRLFPRVFALEACCMSWYALPTNVPWLTLVLVVPLVGALLVALTPSVAWRVIKQLGILTCVITLALVLAIIGGFQQGVGGFHLQFEETLPWIPSLGISYHLGIDGLSLFLLGLHALLFLIAIVVTDSATPRLKEFILLLLILETATAGILLALDLILFYVFWEAMLVPLYFLIGVWGEGRRVYAAFKFLIYTVVGSFAMLVAILAGLVSKLGAYGFLRFNLSLFPDAAHSLGGPLAVLATIGILYGAFMALAQTDLKRLVAYASMSHLGFIGLGIFAGNVLGIEGALVQMINHGVIIAALFLVVGMIERRAGTRLRAELRGLGATAPLFAALFLVVSLAALGLPGLNGFVGEFLIMLGAWSSFLPLAVGPGIDYGAILPELIVVGTAIVVLFLDLAVPADRRGWLAGVTVVGLLAALAASFPLWGQNRAAFGDTVIADSPAAFFNVLLIAIT